VRRSWFLVSEATALADLTLRIVLEKVTVSEGVPCPEMRKVHSPLRFGYPDISEHGTPSLSPSRLALSWSNYIPKPIWDSFDCNTVVFILDFFIFEGSNFFISGLEDELTT